MVCVVPETESLFRSFSCFAVVRLLGIDLKFFKARLARRLSTILTWWGYGFDFLTKCCSICSLNVDLEALMKVSDNRGSCGRG